MKATQPSSFPSGRMVLVAVMLTQFVSSQPVRAQANFQNGTFEQVNFEANGQYPNGPEFASWQRAAGPDDLSAFLVVGGFPPGTSGAGLWVDPLALDWEGAPRVVLSQTITPNPALPAGPLRAILRGFWKREPGNASLPDPDGSDPDPLDFRLVDPNGDVPLVIFEKERRVIPTTGALQPFTAVAELPQLPVVFRFEVLKSAAGYVELDNLVLDVHAPRFQISPVSGPPGGGNVVQISNPSIGPDWQVRFAGVLAQVVDASAGQVTVLVPPHAAGLAEVRLSRTSPNQIIVEPARYRYEEPLSIASVTPLNVSTGGGGELRILGSGFAPEMAVAIGPNPLSAPARFVSTTEIFVALPALAPGEHPVVAVAEPAFAQAPQPLLAEQPPVVENVSPPTGPPGGGTPVTITGSGFLEGATVTFDGTAAPNVTYVSPSEIHAIMPPHQVERVAVAVTNPSGVSGVLPSVFEYVDRTPADVNGDEVIDLGDVILALEAAAGDEPPGPILLQADVNADQRIGLQEAIAAFELAEVAQPGAAFIDPPELVLGSIGVVNAPVFAQVLDGFRFEPVRIDWGDGSVAEIPGADLATPVSHIYERAGNFQVRIISSQGFSPAVPIAVFESAPAIHASGLRLVATGENGQPITGRVGRVNPAQPVRVGIDLLISAPPTGTSATVQGQVRITGPGLETASLLLPWSAQIPGTGALTPVSLEVPVPTAQLTGPNEFFARLEFTSPILSNGLLPPMPVTFQLPGFVTEQDCRAVERLLQDKRLEKEAKVNECEELIKQIADCEQRKGKLEDAKAIAEAERDAIQAEKDAKQQEFDTLFNQINAFCAPVGMLIRYTGPGDIPPGRHFVGAQKAGASAGIGTSFSNGDALLFRREQYARRYGHSIGKDLNKLRDCVVKLDEINGRLNAKAFYVVQLNALIGSLAQAIAAKQAALAVCMAECAALEQEIADLVAQHQACLAQVAAQNAARESIAKARRAAEGVARDVGNASGAADDADDEIGRRVGDPYPDYAKVTAARDCIEEAEQKRVAAEAKLEEARVARLAGDPALAEAKAAEAATLLAEAQNKLLAAEALIRQALLAAKGRKIRLCPDGLSKTGPTSQRTVWDGILDFAITPAGVPPEKWASTIANGQELLDSFAKFFELLDLITEVTGEIGVEVPVASTVTPDIAETAQAIVDAFLEIFARTHEYEVIAKLTGHIEYLQWNQLCVNGCWMPQAPVVTRGPDLVRNCKIGSIYGGTPAERKAQLDNVLNGVIAHLRCP